MNECTEIIALLSDYLDRDLPPDMCGTIEAHLTGCLTCSNAAAGLRHTIELCRKSAPMDRPAPLSATQRNELRVAFETVLRSMQKKRSDEE